MTMTFNRLARLALVPVLITFAGAASAQATRTWVSGVGDDANPCSRTAPCKTFAGAISKTAAGGEINAIDPGGFGGVTITKSITIRAYNVEAGVLVSGTNGINVNVAATDRVILEGLDIEGLGTSPNGVNIVGGGIVIIRGSSIRRFTGDCVRLAATAGARVSIENSNLQFCGGGLSVQGIGGVTNNAIIHESTLDAMTNYHVSITGPGAVFLSGSHLVGGSQPKLVASGGGAINSYGNNVIRDPLGVTPTALPLR